MAGRVTSSPVDGARLEAFQLQVARDLAHAATAATVILGDALGLYQALAEAGPLTATELALSTGTAGEYISGWLACQARAGYLEHEPSTGRYRLPGEHLLVLADDHSPYSLRADVQSMAASMALLLPITELLRLPDALRWPQASPIQLPTAELALETLLARNQAAP